MNPYVILDGALIALIVPLSLAEEGKRSCLGRIKELDKRGVPPSRELAVLYEIFSSASSAFGSDGVPTRDTAPVDTSRWIPVRDAARLVGITERAIRKAISAKRVQAQMFGRGYLVNPKSLEEVYGKCPVPQ